MENSGEFLGKQTLEAKEELLPNVVLVETDKAKFRIAYGRHDIERNPHELGDADALMIESWSRVDYTLAKESVEDNFNGVLKNKKLFETEFKKIFQKAEEEKIPVFVGDITIRDITVLLQEYLRAVEPVIGAALLGKLAYNSIIEQKKLSRREFVKKTLAGFYFLSELPSAVTGYFLPDESLDKESSIRSINKFVMDLNEEVHPEKYAIIITLRNYLFAQKMETIAEKLEIEDKKPELVFTVGDLHYGIEKALGKENEERVGLIDKLLSVPGLKETREKIATIARFDFNQGKNKWEMTDRFKDPHLAKIEK